MSFWQTSLFDNNIVGNSYEKICNSITDNKSSYLKPDLFGKKIHSWSVKHIKKPINTLCLFSGAGGLDIGFHDAGFKVVECVEIEKQFVKSLIENKSNGKYFQETNIVCEDIRKYKPSFKTKIDFIIGGPPCQSFSKAGIRAAGAKGINDDRGTLFEEYVRVLKQLKPKGFLFENVTGILSAQKGEAMKAIVKAFEDVGYTLTYRVLDTADFGVPQNRERLILVGMKKGMFKFPAPTHGVDSDGEIDYYSAFKALEGVRISPETGSGLNGRFGPLLNEIPPGLNYSYYTERMGHPKPVFAWRSKFSDFLYKADPELPVRTLKASGGQYTGPFHWNNRPFNTNELKRLQTFPDDYVIVGGKGVCAKQIGNSVPPQFARMLALSVVEQVFGIKLPFKLNKLEEYHALSFRKLKSKRTKYYFDKAQSAINELDFNDTLKSKIKSRKYYAKVLENTVLKEYSENVKDSYHISFKSNSKAWVFKLNEEESEDDFKELYTVKINHKNNSSLFNEIREVRLVSDSVNYETYLILWKAFERELIQNNIKADLVQLNGYYQYKPILKIDISIKIDELPNKIKNVWKFLKLVAYDENYSKIRDVKEISNAYELSIKELISVFNILKKIGFEIRNTNTNSEIKEGHYLIPYSFPSLNSQSLQLAKKL